jgi:trk system potassium uptake protein TrkA
MQIVTLKELGVQNFDICIVAIGENFQASLEITNNLKELGAQYIITKSSSEIQSKFLQMAGADDVVYPDRDIAEKIAVRCNATNLFDYIQISNQYSIFEVKVKKSWVGRSIKELDIRNKYDVNVIAISNKGVVSMPTPSYVFYEGDHVYLFGKDNVIKKLKD